jgi:hypothetical protein
MLSLLRIFSVGVSVVKDAHRHSRMLVHHNSIKIETYGCCKARF